MSGYDCASCGKHHDELPLCFLAGDPYPAAVIPKKERAARVERSSDQCIVDGNHFYVLGNLDVPIVGHTETVRWTVWTSLSEKSFARVSELWETAGREREPPYFGWLCTEIPGYPSTLALALSVVTQPVGVRPVLVVSEQDHPLFFEQRDGISWDRARELSAVAMGSGG